MREIKSMKEFNDLINQDKPVLLDFYADWCGPCQMLLPIVDRLADKYADDIEVAKINVDINPELSTQFNVRSIPALFFVVNNKVVHSSFGLQSEAALDQKITEIKDSINVQA